MDTNSSLGVLKVSPREVRDQIYQYFIAQQLRDPEYRLPEDLRLGSTGDQRDLTNFMRVSKYVYEEISQVIYNGWELYLTPAFVLQFTGFPEPQVHIKLQHDKYGEFSFCKAGDTTSSTLQSMPLLNHLPHHRWRAVEVNIPFHGPEETGLTLAWWASMKLMVNAFEVNPPQRLIFRPEEAWEMEQDMQSSISSELHSMLLGGGLGLLMLPFGRLRSSFTQLELHVHKDLASLLFRHENRLSISRTRLYMDLKRVDVHVNNGLESEHTNMCDLHLLGDLVHQDKTDAWLDYRHDVLRDHYSTELRVYQIRTFDKEHELHMTHCISLWDSKTAGGFMRAFAQRFAEWYEMRHKAHTSLILTGEREQDLEFFIMELFYLYQMSLQVRDEIMSIDDMDLGS